MPVAYPTGLRQPLRASRSRRQPAAFEWTQPRRGLGYAQPIGSGVPVLWDVQWRLTQDEAATFLRWFTEDLDRGLLEFEMPLRTEFGLSNYACQFLPDALLTAREEGALWTYTATIHARELVVPEPPPPPDQFFENVHTLMMPLDATTPPINYAPVGGTISRGGTTLPTMFATGGPFTGVGYIQGGSGNPAWWGPVLGAYVDDWTFDCYVNYLGTTHSQNAGILRLPANLNLNIDCTPGDGNNGTLDYRLSGITVWRSSVLSVGLHHIQLESRLIAPSTRRARIWIDGALAMDGVALGVGSAVWTTTQPPVGGTNSSSGFANIPFPVSCWRFTKSANRNWDDATFTPPQALSEYFPPA